MDICYIYIHEVSSDISHVGIKEAMDTNLLEVAGSSETAHTLATCDHLDSIRTTTNKGDDYKAKLQPSSRETHWQTLVWSTYK